MWGDIRGGEQRQILAPPHLDLQSLSKARGANNNKHNIAALFELT
jgi:hypothetical protein